MIDMEKLRDFVRLRRRKNALDAELKEVNKDLQDRARELPGDLIDAGLDSLKISVDGDTYTLFPQTKLRSKPVDPDALAAALSGHGYADLVKEYVHHATLNSLVKEFYDSDEGIPEWLDDVTTTFEDTQLIARKS